MRDLISRQAAIDTLKDNVIEMGGDDFTERGVHEDDIDTIINKLPSARPNLQPTCDKLATDCISRQAAIDLLKQMRKDGDMIPWEGKDAFARIRKLPSAQPELIRCKDCKWYEGDIMANPWGVCCHDGWTSDNIGHEVTENGWCYRAERKTK